MSSEEPTNNNQPIYGEDEYMYSDDGMSLDERKAEAMKKYEEKWLKDQGVNPFAHILGETIVLSIILLLHLLYSRIIDPYYPLFCSIFLNNVFRKRRK